MQGRRSRIRENSQLARGIYRMVLETAQPAFTAPGQFAMLEVSGKFLRRPISVSSYDSEGFTLIYRVVGEGTRILSQMAPGDSVDVLTGLGKGYDLEAIPNASYVIGGGIGIPPMLGLTRALLAAGKSCSVVLGYASAEEIFLREEFEALGCALTLMTDDGSAGRRGLVTEAFDRCSYACACGPLPMLRALEPKVAHGQFSLEARMGCGFGACMGCSVRTIDGSRRVCKEGPVFDKEVIAWESL